MSETSQPPGHLRLLAGALRQTLGWPLRDRLAARADRALAEHGWVEEREIEGVRWYLDLDDTACRTAYLDGCHEPETSFYLEHLIRPGDRLWDVGTCHGFVSLRMAQRAGPDGRVDSFEPLAANRGRLEKNLELNPDLAARITVHPYALSSRPGTVMMQRTSARNPGASHIVTARPAEDKGRARAGEAGTETVETKTADTVWVGLQKPSVAGVKIDVEGHELQVLAGMEEMVRTAAPKWFLVEVRNTFLLAAGGSREEVFAWFAARGYQAQSLVAGNRLKFDPVPRDGSAILFLREKDSV